MVQRASPFCGSYNGTLKIRGSLSEAFLNLRLKGRIRDLVVLAAHHNCTINRMSYKEIRSVDIRIALIDLVCDRVYCKITHQTYKLAIHETKKEHI